MNKVVCISDTHLRRLPDILKGATGDMLIGAGDFLNSGSYMDFIRFYEDLLAIRKDFEYILLVAGNHDLYFQRYTQQMKERLIELDVDYLEDNGMSYPDLDLYVHGTPWVPRINDIWAFESREDDESDIAVKFELIPNREDVEEKNYFLATHTPPRGILSGPWGSEELLDKVLVAKPDVNIFGHVHFAHGQKEFNGIHFYNVAICDEGYKASNPPMVIEINE